MQLRNAISIDRLHRLWVPLAHGAHHVVETEWLLAGTRAVVQPALESWTCAKASAMGRRSQCGTLLFEPMLLTSEILQARFLKPRLGAQIWPQSLM